MSSQTDKLRQQGANARALGRGIFDNPYFRGDNLPAKTGETIAAWQEKVEAWEFGWRMEDAMRPLDPLDLLRPART